ncbi:Chaperone J-domain-containing protein [Venustampulla echinocandica]|uniref:Chaperone J-domain-containing protein n=1 Tax=Venustampulla echinocandica TaxID=2656787 RepID=A0A370TY37_9HELO|nr:Chaperone J-domain-containing protein [Venustampulla echinocandica]RDL40445.1 Chaperone J-domain-containing protein [Venustampulla echinocandica]
MSGTDYSYDEQGQFFPVFILTIVGIVTVPLTYSVLKPSTDAGATAPRIKTDYRPKHVDLIDIQRKAQRRKDRRLKRIIAVVVGWAVMALMVYLIVVTARLVPKIWNPYDILGISDSASEREIKSHYKRLSLRFHPDKIRPDPAKNQTLESLNDYFVELTKAYKALTDEEIRNNYIQFGHPDGKQSFSIGIALPKFIITEGNGKYVILVYAALLGVLLPYLVGSWWYGTQKMSKEKVLIESANNLFQEYEEDITEGGIIAALSTGVEFQKILKGEKAESGLGKLESRILAEGDATPFAAGLSAKDRTTLDELEGGVRRKALALLWAYLGRVELDDAALDQAKLEVAPIAQALNSSFNAIALAFGTTAPILSSFLVGQSLLQAMPPGASPLLQLPHFTPAIAKAVEGDSRTHLTLQQYMQLPETYRRRLTIGNGLLTESQYTTAIKVAKQLPRLQVEKAFFKVTGEKFIIPSSLVSLVIKGRFIPPGSENVPQVNELDLEDVDPEEGDLDAILGRKKKTGKGEAAPAEDKPVQPPLAYAPYFTRDYSPRWHVFLTDSKQGKIAVPPFTFTTFDKPIYGADGKPTFNMQTLKAQFQAPPQAGHYTFVMHLVCDSYVGFDTKMEVTLVVDEASKAVDIEAEDDISEPDEDSLAGQMHALKTGAPPPKKSKKVVEESSDDESNTDGEADDDTSDTDTDTDEE